MADWLLALAEMGEAVTAFINERLPFRRRDSDESGAADGEGGAERSFDEPEGELDG